MEDELNQNECDNYGIELDEKNLAESDRPDDNIINIKFDNDHKIRFDLFLDGARLSSSRHYYALEEYSQISQLSVSCCKIGEGKHSLVCAKNILETYILYSDTKKQKQLYKLKSNNLREDLPPFRPVRQPKPEQQPNTIGQEDLVQYRLREMEMKLVSDLAKYAKRKKIEHFLLKDGIITKCVDNSYFHVVGVSKQFHNIYPENLNEILPKLDKGWRTYAVWDQKCKTGDFYRAVWYLKLRGQTESLDHIVRCEVVKRDHEPIPTEDINAISEAVFLYAYPVPYDQDSRNRWRTHLYPIFETEQFCKSQFYSTEVLNYYVEPILLNDKTKFTEHGDK